MKNKKFIIKFALKNFFKAKKNIYNILIVGLLFSLIIFSFSFKESLQNYWNSSVEKLVDYRTYIIQYDTSKYNEEEAIKKLKNYKHIVASYNLSSYLISMSVKNDSEVPSDNHILLVGTIDNPVDIVSGSKLSNNYSKLYPIICAKQFYPFIEYKQGDYLKSKSVDFSNRIGTELELSFIMSDEIEKFEIVGLYDAKKSHIEGNVCCTNYQVVEILNNKYQSDVFSADNIEPGFLYIVIDELNNEEITKVEIENDGFSIINPILKINKSTGNNIISLLFTISINLFLIFSSLKTFSYLIFLQSTPHLVVGRRIYLENGIISSVISQAQTAKDGNTFVPWDC